jgi:hypothetical protein
MERETYRNASEALERDVKAHRIRQARRWDAILSEAYDAVRMLGSNRQARTSGTRKNRNENEA